MIKNKERHNSYTIQRQVTISWRIPGLIAEKRASLQDISSVYYAINKQSEVTESICFWCSSEELQQLPEVLQNHSSREKGSLPTWLCPWSAALWGGQLLHHSDMEIKKDKVLRRIPNIFKRKPLQTLRGASKGAQSLEEISRLNSYTETGGNLKVLWVKVLETT